MRREIGTSYGDSNKMPALRRSILALAAFALACLLPCSSAPMQALAASSGGSGSAGGALTTAAASKAKPAKAKVTSAKASKNTITVKYNAVKGAKKYQVAYKAKSARKWTAKNAGTKRSFKISGLKYNTAYQVKVRAYNGRWGSWSAIKTVKTPKNTTAVSLASLNSIASNTKEASVLTDNYGNKYGNAISNERGLGFGSDLRYEYLVNGKYSRFRGTLYIPEGESSSTTLALIVKGDGKVLYTSPVMGKASRPVSVDVNIAGIDDLTIEWTNSSGSVSMSDLCCCIANPRLMPYNPGDKKVDLSKYPVALTDLTSIYSSLSSSTRMEDNHGNLYATAIYNRVDNLHGNAIPTYEFLLDSKYSKLTGALYVPKGQASSKGVSMTVIADGKTIYTSPAMDKGSAPIKVSIPLSGCNDIKITFSERDWFGSSGDPTLCFANPRLYS